MPENMNVIDFNGNRKQRAAELFLEWVGKNVSPDASTRILAAATQNSELGAADQVIPVSVPWYEKVLTAAGKILPAYQQYKTQSKIIDLQLDRARRGEPPLSIDQYAAPPVRVQVGPAFTTSLNPAVKTALWFGAGLFTLLILTPMIKKALR